MLRKVVLAAKYNNQACTYEQEMRIIRLFQKRTLHVDIAAAQEFLVGYGSKQTEQNSCQTTSMGTALMTTPKKI